MKNGFIKIMLVLAVTSLTACTNTTSFFTPQVSPPAGEAIPNKAADEKTLTPSTAGVYTNNPQNTLTASNTAIGGNILQSMDVNDKTKMSRGLDKAVGKSTSWTNEATGIQYTVNPIQKVVVNGNQFCRKYTLTATKGENTREVNEVACVGTDGEWHGV